MRYIGSHFKRNQWLKPNPRLITIADMTTTSLKRLLGYSLMASALTSSVSTTAFAQGVAIAKNDAGIQVKHGETTALRYELLKPKDSPSNSPSAGYFHPLTTPSGLVITDVGPDDHRHHRGVFLAWLNVNNKIGKGDFWGWGEPAPIENRRIVNRQANSVSSTDKTASFSVVNDWVAESTPLMEETLQAKLTFNANARIHDLAYSFKVKEDTTLGRYAFSGFSVRTRKDYPITVHDPAGTVSLPAPSHLKPESDWPNKPWYAFELSLAEGKKAGVAVLSHPKNPTTVWHNVTGIGLINPCIIAPGAVNIPASQPLNLRYQVVTFDGPVPTALLNQLAEDFAKSPVSVNPQ